MKQDLQIFNLIKKEEERQTAGIELIASENYVSDQVLEALGSICTNKYAEGYPGARYYGGCEVVDQIEQLAIDRLCEIFEAEYANVQPHSGAQANMAVLMSCLKPGDTFMGLDLAHGGHLTHGSPVNMSGILYNAVAYGLNEQTGMVDYEQMEQRALEFKPKLIIGGASAYSREWDYARMREIADKVGAIFWVDMAHTAGLIAAGLLSNPVKYAHIVTSTTHKTLRGPRGGIILMGKDFDNPWGITTPKGIVKKMSQILNSSVFPGVQGGPLEHCIAAKAVSFYEALQPEGSFDDWVQHIKKIRSEGKFENMIYLVASFASVLIEPLDALPFILDIYGPSGRGKTVALMMACSVWANPDESQYIGDFKTTDIFHEYIHKYYYNKSIADGYTLKIATILLAINIHKVDSLYMSICC